MVDGPLSPSLSSKEERENHPPVVRDRLP